MEYNVDPEFVKKVMGEHGNEVLKKVITDKNRKDLMMEFSDLATNVVEWAGIENRKNVLVVGDVYGNITSYLAKKNDAVVCLSDAANRKKLMIRCQGEDNVIFPNILSEKDKFDAIVILDGNSECVKMIDYLEKEGEAVISLKNDESDLSKKTKEYLTKKGFGEVQCYYPYPDSYFMMLLIAEDMLDKVEDFRMPFYGAEYKAMYKDDEVIGMGKNIIPQQGRHFLFYVNTRFVSGTDSIKYIKYSNERRDYYRIKTAESLADDARVFRKEALSLAASTHLKKMKWSEGYFNKRFINSKICLAKSRIADAAIEFEFIEGESLLDILEGYLDSNIDMLVKQIDDFFEELDKLIDGYFVKTKKFIAYFGNVELSPELKASSINNIDLIFQNVIVQNGKYVVIDYEWVFKFPIPLNYIKWRSLFYFFKNRDIKAGKIFEECKNKLGITQSEENCYLKMEDSFQKFIYGQR